MKNAMRKALIIFILVFAFSLGLGAFAVYDAAQPRDEVLVSENLRYGEASAAEGLNLTMHTNFDNHLFWDISYIPGQPEKTENECRVSVKKDYGDYEYEPIGMNLMSDVEGWYFDDFADRDPTELSGLSLAYYELWLDTPNGGEREELIHLKDYLDYYPVGGEVDVDGLTIPFYMDWPSIEDYSYAVHRQMNDYFKIPVMEDEVRYISLRKDEQGNLRGRGSGTGDKDTYNIWSHSVVLSDAVYFTINNRSNEGKIVDTSLIPGGYGIYRLPYTVENGVCEIQFEELSTPKSIDEEFNIIYMFTDEPKEKIILIGLLNTELRMLVIDAATMETLQDIEIAGDSEGCWQYNSGGDFIALGLDDGRLALVEKRESGEYLLRFVIEDEAHGKLYNRYEAQAWAWDGEKLAVSGYKSLDDIDERFVADFYCAVYDETGLLCFTDCDSSLFVNKDAQWNCVRGNDVNSMELKWN